MSGKSHHPVYAELANAQSLEAASYTLGKEPGFLLIAGPGSDSEGIEINDVCIFLLENPGIKLSRGNVSLWKKPETVGREIWLRRDPTLASKIRNPIHDQIMWHNVAPFYKLQITPLDFYSDGTVESFLKGKLVLHVSNRQDLEAAVTHCFADGLAKLNGQKEEWFLDDEMVNPDHICFITEFVAEDLRSGKVCKRNGSLNLKMQQHFQISRVGPPTLAGAPA